MYLFFDIGGTRMRAGVSDDLSSIKSSTSADTPGSFDEGVEKIKEMAGSISGAEKIDGIAIGVAGPVDKKEGILVNSPHLPGWIGKPLLKYLSQEFNAPIHVENDTALSGLGEAAYGKGKGFDIVAYLTISTGVAGVRIKGGRIDENSFGFEIGHQIIDVAQMRSAEDLLSGTAAEEEFGKRSYEIEDKEFWEKRAELLSVLVHNTIMYWSPQVVVLGGSMVVGEKGPVIQIEKVVENLKKISTIHPVLPEIKKARLKDETGLWGGMEYLRQMKEGGII